MSEGNINVGIDVGAVQALMFPENEVAILQDYRKYVPNNIQAVITGLRGSLMDPAAEPAVGPEVGGGMPLRTPENTPAHRVELARKHLLRFLMFELRGLETPLKYIDDNVFTPILHREFPIALNNINKIRSGLGIGPDGVYRPWEIRGYFANWPRSTIDAHTITTALDPASYTFTGVAHEQFPDDSLHPQLPRPMSMTLPGYAGPRLNPGQIAKLVELHEWLGGGAERAFRLGCH
jgi:hypothetical protein